MHPLLTVALGFFLLFLLFYVIHSFFLVYHLLRFSVRHDTARSLAIVFAIVSLALLMAALGVLLNVSWGAPTFVPFGTSASSQIR